MIILMDLEHVCGFSLPKYTTLVLGWNQGYPGVFLALTLSLIMKMVRLHGGQPL